VPPHGGFFYKRKLSEGCGQVKRKLSMNIITFLIAVWPEHARLQAILWYWIYPGIAAGQDIFDPYK
jgi:hypothetical protein